MGIMMMSLVVGKVIITLIIDGLFQGKLSNLIIGILMKMNLSQAEADVIYQNIFRANRDVFQWIGFMLLFLVGYYAVLSKTANYLKNIGDGIDNVLANSKQPIELETELEPIAEKLNTMKMTLARKERMAQESEQRKNDLVVYLAHDLKTPLTSVIAYLSMLDEKPDMPPEERKKYIHIAHTKAIRLSELISEFFEITKFNLQNIRLEKETINLSLMLEQIMDEFYAVFADNNLTGNIYTEEDLMVEGDPDNLPVCLTTFCEMRLPIVTAAQTLMCVHTGKVLPLSSYFLIRESRSRNRNCRPYLKSSTVRTIPDRARPEEPDLDFRWQKRSWNCMKERSKPLVTFSPPVLWCV